MNNPLNGIITNPLVPTATNTSANPMVPDPFFETHSVRALAVIDGTRYQVNEITMDLVAHGASDTVTVVMPNRQPPGAGQSQAQASYPDWSTVLYRGEDDGNANAPVTVTLYAGFDETQIVTAVLDTSQLNVIFTGIVDQYEIDEPDGATTFRCRSLAAPLTTNKITTQIQNMTTVAFVEQQAARFGLTVKFLTANAPLKLADVYGDSFTTGLRSLFIWDVMLRCAQFDDVDIWVDASGVLWYAAPQLVERNTVGLEYGRDLVSYKFIHALQFSRNIRVQVHAYTKKIKQSVATRVDSQLGGGIVVSQVSRTVETSPSFGTNNVTQYSTSSTGAQTVTQSETTGGAAAASSGSSSATSDTGKETYIYYLRPNSQQSMNLPQFCAQMATQIWRQITMHEYQLSVTIAVTPRIATFLDITALINITKAPYRAMNTTFWPRQMTHTISTDAGWKLSLNAVNHVLPSGAV